MTTARFKLLLGLFRAGPGARSLSTAPPLDVSGHIASTSVQLPGRKSSPVAGRCFPDVCASSSSSSISFGSCQPRERRYMLPSRWLSSAIEHGPEPLNAGSPSCWSCNHRFKKGGVVCTGCEKIQPLDSSLNYFEILGMPSMKYDIDLALLDKRYKRLQWQVHPDRLASRDEVERDFSAHSVMHINMAYSVLKNPLSRANYLLAERGVVSEEGAESTTISDPEFLMEVMEAREEVEDTEDPAKLQLMVAANREQQAALVQRLCRAFESPSGSGEAMELTCRLSYLARLEEAIVEKLPTA